MIFKRIRIKCYQGLVDTQPMAKESPTRRNTSLSVLLQELLFLPSSLVLRFPEAKIQARLLVQDLLHQVPVVMATTLTRLKELKLKLAADKPSMALSALTQTRLREISLTTKMIKEWSHWLGTSEQLLVDRMRSNWLSQRQSSRVSTTSLSPKFILNSDKLIGKRPMLSLPITMSRSTLHLIYSLLMLVLSKP